MASHLREHALDDGTGPSMTRDHHRGPAPAGINALRTVPHPLFQDPIHDGAADPTVFWNAIEACWWMIYTSRRASSPVTDPVSWVHGTALAVASSEDDGTTWLYRGTLQGLDIEPGHHTYWAPEVVVSDDGALHLYVSAIRGIPSTWSGHPRAIRHYESIDGWTWTYVQTLRLGGFQAIDACVHPLPNGEWRLWFKNESDDSHTWAVDSGDLYHWGDPYPAVTDRPHEGCNVFALGGQYWMLVDEWRGLAVHHSTDLVRWARQGLILDEPGRQAEDGAIGQHADVVVRGDDALVFYFTHPDATRRSVIQMARLRVEHGELVCDRDEPVLAPPLPRP